MAGNVGMPGSPMLHFDLLVDSTTGYASGHARITQVVAPPGVNIHIRNVTGTVCSHAIMTRVLVSVALSGTYDQKGPPPTDYIIVQPFAAQFSLDAQWDGRGSFNYGPNVINDVPVTSAVWSGDLQTMSGVVITGAAATGDLVRMKEVAAQADQYLARSSEIQKALADLKAAIGKVNG